MALSARLEVDGHVFEVSEHAVPGETTMWQLDWFTGPNPGYGFSTSEPIRFATGDEPLGEFEMTDDHLIAQARSFLESVDPETGYM